MSKEGFCKKLGLQDGSWAPPEKNLLSPSALAALVSFSWVSPIVHKAVKETVLQEDDAKKLQSGTDRAPTLATRFETEFAACQVLFVGATSTMRSHTLFFCAHTTTDSGIAAAAHPQHQHSSPAVKLQALHTDPALLQSACAL